MSELNDGFLCLCQGCNSEIKLKDFSFIITVDPPFKSDLKSFTKCFCMECSKNLKEVFSKGSLSGLCDQDKKDKKTQEAVNHPSHYQGKRFEVIDIIEDFDLSFNTGNAVKYILRALCKENYVQDLEKAIWYLKREAEMIKREKENVE